MGVVGISKLPFLQVRRCDFCFVGTFSGSIMITLEAFGMTSSRGFLPAEDPVRTNGLIGNALIPFEELAADLPGRFG